MLPNADALTELKAKIVARYRVAESELLPPLLGMLEAEPEETAAVQQLGRELIARLRNPAHRGWIDHFLQEYGLSTTEGVALLSLAEAYLRVPDADTADALIQDKIGEGNWSSHRGASKSFMVNQATLGLVMTRALVRDDDQAGVLRRLVSRAGEPAIRGAVAAAMRIMGDQFVLGRAMPEALSRARVNARAGFRHSFDMLGEAAFTADDAAHYHQSYLDAIRALGKDGQSAGALWERDSVSVKLSALHPRYEVFHADRCIPELTDRLMALAIEARQQGVGLTVDAEEADRLMLSLDVISAVAGASELRDWDGLGMAVQAYQRRAPAVLDWADALAAATGRRLTVRLVKGAYWDSEIKWAQERGLSDFPVWTRKSSTDICYLACARRMLAATHLYPAFATHNAHTVATLLHWIGDRRDLEFQRLHGMGVGLYERLVQEQGYGVRIYAPVGGHRELLAYLVRRLLENGANTSFVHQIADPSMTDAALLLHPVARLQQYPSIADPAIVPPRQLFGEERVNSDGIDLSDEPTLETLSTGLALLRGANRPAALDNGVRIKQGTNIPVLCPANTAETVGEVVEAELVDVEAALGAATVAQASWSRSDVAVRSRCLSRMADLLVRDREILLSLLMREAGKTVADALAELREAEDFCRYYAVSAARLWRPEVLPGPTGERNELSLTGRGVFACISPWNFPLAIFLGQVAAALVAGNAVVAKPAPQTPLVAMHAVRLLHEAGVPDEVLHLLPGGGLIGQALVADRRVDGVAFTGSTATARAIARSLLEDDSRPLVPLIAETGGLNAMIVDSTALPEQVVRDVLVSGFRSAGQRCSALRLLCLQEDIAERTLEMLVGAMQELRVGDPADFATDIGPVIDEASARRLLAHVDAHRDAVIAQPPLPSGLPAGHYVTPTLIRLASIDALRHEVFGPIVHVVTWKRGELEQTIARINAAGYGLTMGVHSRIEAVVNRVRAQARVGNLYVNRSMIGAVVGSQPFGGEGLSGTGFKAGGPHYLLRFASERVLSVDTTSAGGNASLLATLGASSESDSQVIA